MVTSSDIACGGDVIEVEMLYMHLKIWQNGIIAILCSDFEDASTAMTPKHSIPMVYGAIFAYSCKLSQQL